MSGVSNIAQSQQMINNLLNLQSTGNTLEQQISTGLVSESYAGIAPQAAQLVNLTTQQSQQQSYISNITTVSTQLQSMNLVTSTVAGLVQQFAGQVSSDAYSTTGQSIQTSAQQLLQEIGGYLNTQGTNGYLFSGSDTSTPPVDLSSLPNPGDLTTSVSGAPPNGYYQGNDQIATVQADTSLSVPYGITADNPAFEQAIRALNFLANSGTLSASNPTDAANVATAQTMLDNSATALQQLTATTGDQEAQLTNMQQEHQSALSLAQSSIGDIENVNSATAITQLDQLQTQLQASYQTINVLQSLSLASYLK